MELERSKELPEQVKKFNKGEHLALGITQILLGIVTFLFGVVLELGYYYRYFFSFVTTCTALWSGLLYIVSGSMSVAAARNPKLPLVKGMLGINVICTLTAVIAISLAAVTLEDSTRNGSLCSTYFDSTQDPAICYEHVMIPHKIYCAIMIVLLVFSVLEFCITIANAAFGCKAVCNETITEMIVVIYQNPPPGNAVGPPADGKDVWTS